MKQESAALPFAITGLRKSCPSWSDEDPFSIADYCTLDGISKIWKKHQF